MNEAAEAALVAILLQYPDLVTLVADRVTWDDAEYDLPRDSITLRNLSSRFPATELRSRGGLRECLVELVCRSDTRTGASVLADVVVEALSPFECGSVIASGVKFAAIRLQDVQQVPTINQRSYRKQLIYNTSFYE